MRNNNVVSNFGMNRWPHYSDEEIEAVVRVLRSGKVNQWTGHEVKAFEKEYADYLGVKYAIALANGSVALDLAMNVLGIGVGDEVIVTPRTFVASASCIALSGAKPIFVDVDENSQNIMYNTVRNAISSKTRAVIAVHLAGWPCELDALRALCDERNLYLIEDCSQAHGAKYKDKPVGSFGDVSIFSFCQDKIISTGGEGGLLVTDDEEIWKRAWSYKDHGKDYDLMFNALKPKGFNWAVKSFGTNYRMTEMQAAIGRIQLKKLNSWVAKRRNNAKILTQCFSKISALRITIPHEDVYHSYYKYYAFIKPEALKSDWNRDGIIGAINEDRMLCSTGSCSEVYLEKAFESFRPTEGMPMARRLGKTSLMFMVHPTISEEYLASVCDKVAEVFKRAIR